MPVIRNEVVTDFNRTMDAMDVTVSQIKAVSRMLEYTLRAGDDVSEISCGVESLLLQQCDDLRFLRNTITDQYRHAKEAKLEIKSPERIAEWAGVSQQVVNRVISIATGIKLGPLSKQQADERHSFPQQERASTQSDFPPHTFNEEFGHQVAPANMGD